MNIVWFRDDLRTADNPALHAAAEAGGPVACVYVLEECESFRPPGAAARWWLHHSLLTLDASLNDLGAYLVLRRGDPERALQKLVDDAGAKRVFWNRRYAPSEAALDARIKTSLAARGIGVESFNANLLNEP